MIQRKEISVSAGSGKPRNLEVKYLWFRNYYSGYRLC